MIQNKDCGTELIISEDNLKRMIDELVNLLPIHDVSDCIRIDEYGKIITSKELDACTECKYKGNTGVEKVCIHCLDNNDVDECYR